MPNSRVAIAIYLKLTNPSFDIWKPKYTCLDKECSKCQLFWPIYVLLVSQSLEISLHFSLRNTVFEIQAILRQVHWMTSKWPKNLQGQVYPIYVLLVSKSPKFISFALRPASCCSVAGHFEKGASNYPKMTLNPTKSNVPHICFTSIHESQISLRSLHGERFLRYRPFWEDAPNGLQMTLNTTSSKIPSELLVSLISKVHSASIYGQPFLRYSHFETSTPNATKMTLKPTWYQGTRYVCYYWTRVPNFTPFRSMARSFQDTSHFETSSLNDPKLTLNLTRSN